MCQAAENEGKFQVPPPSRCHATTALRRFQDDAEYPQPDALIWSARLGSWAQNKGLLWKVFVPMITSPIAGRIGRANYSVGNFVGQLALMVVLTLVLYSWLLTSQRASMHAMLLIGVMLGAGLGSVSTFMQRLLTPSDFDVLTARLFGSVANADASYLPLAIPLCVASAAALWWRSRRLNLVGLGRDVSTNLGLDHRRDALEFLGRGDLTRTGPGRLTADVDERSTCGHHLRSMPQRCITPGEAATIGKGIGSYIEDAHHLRTGQIKNPAAEGQPGL